MVLCAIKQKYLKTRGIMLEKSENLASIQVLLVRFPYKKTGSDSRFNVF